VINETRAFLGAVRGLN